MRLVPRNRVLFALITATLLCCAFTGFVSVAPNRLVSGTPLSLWQTGLGEPVAALAFVLLALSFVRTTVGSQIAVMVVAIAALVALILDAGTAASLIMTSARPATRVSLAGGFWAAGLCLAMIVLDALLRLKASGLVRLGIAVLIVAVIVVMALSGEFDSLSLAREYAARRGEFAAELARHCELVFVSVAIALVIGAPLGVAVTRWPRLGPGVFSALNLLQTIPSVALFGVLIAPLSALGLGGIGATPAIIALVLYSLLPIVRNTHAGIVGIDAAVIDAARAMGMTQGQILWRIELPLGLPVFLAGLHIVTVQAIGLTVVAALIGAGGLGSFVFQGIGQYAIDLVLLGAVPTILLALAAGKLVRIVVADAC
ncbi:MAG TPA: ABC transporter permease, partial [Stellaceae bacterium]|nr:ABC transporter permease [Stellaceae bacterium]